MAYELDADRVISVLTLVGVIVLLFWTSGLTLTQEGFHADDSGASMRYAGERSDGYASASHVVANQRHDTVEGLGANEPPVFWNAGSYKDVNQWMANTTNQAVDVDYRLTPDELAAKNAHTEGMYGRKGPAYEGMVNRYSDEALKVAALGF
jgi:hypothetical protein